MEQENSQADQKLLFDEVQTVVADPLRFKAKLGIGSDAYLTMKVGKRLQSLWDVGGFAATGAGVAASTTVASTFFSGGFLSTIGLGAAAATPIGWVVGAAVASGAAYYGVTRLFSGYGEDRVVSIPKFINTPIDVLGTRLVELIAPLAIKLARIDGKYDPRERNAIAEYFINEWGIDSEFLKAALTVIEENTSDQSLNDIVTSLADFKKANPDCNYHKMCADIMGFLEEVAVADDFMDEREEMAIERIQKVLLAKGRLSMADLKNYVPAWSKRSG
jgi:uncharacterized tellurite resistance protein B-like protein